MRFLLTLILLLLAPAAALADAEAHQGRNWIRVTALPCTDAKVIAIIQAAGEDPLDYHAASANWDGKDFQGCWRPLMQQRMFFLRYDDGDDGLVPFDVMKPLKEA